MNRLLFWLQVNRIGPDIPLTHIFFYSKRLGRWWAKKKLMGFGEGAEIRPFSYLVESNYISIGRNVIIRPGCMFFADSNEYGTGYIYIEDYCLIGSGVHIYASNHKYTDTDKKICHQGHMKPEPVIVKEGAWLGANVILLPGVVIGRNSVIGAGSVVTKSVPDYTVAAGNPAVVIKDLNQ